MATENPFLLFKVECPICKTINEFEQIKVGAFTEESRDTDFCPQGIKWRLPKFQAYNPLLFFVATCSNCYYSREFSNNYRDWKSDNAFRTYRLKAIKPKHLEELSNADSIVKRLGDAINTDLHPNESAILKLLLAVFDEKLTEHAGQLDLGRLYLRIAWVFRSLGQGEDPTQLRLAGLVRDIDSKYDKLANTLSEARSRLDELGQSIKQQFKADQLPAAVQSQMFTFRDQYDEKMNDLNRDVSSSENQLTNLQSLISEYRRAILGSRDGGGQAAFGEWASFSDCLSKIKSGWTDAVTCEQEAIEKAIFHYKTAFADGHDISTGAPQIQASYLIAELSRRIGDYDEARQFFTSTIKAGQEFIYQNRNDRARTAMARKILELAIEQGRINLKAAKPA